MRISLALAAALAALPFLFAEHRLPLRSFYDEWLGAALGMAAAGAFALARGSARRALPDVALWLALFAAWLAAHAVLRPPAYAQLPLLGIAYVLLAAQLACLGRALADELGAERTADAVAVAILCGATANAVIGIAQFYGVPDMLGGFIATSAGPRIAGHVGQTNLFAGYLALGQASALYLVARGRLPVRGLWLAASVLVLAAAYSQSRSAIVFSVWIAALALFMRGRGAPWQRLSNQAAVLAAGTAAAMLAVPLVHDFPGRLLDAHVADPRPALWGLAWRLFTDAPWLGVGWGEFAGAAFAAGLPPALAVRDTIWGSPHNLLLQLAAEAGFVAAALIVVLLARWGLHLRSALREAAALPAWWAAAVVGTIAVHALVEYPLWYAHVLALAALVAGMASRPVAQVPAGTLRAGLAAAGAGAAALLAWILVDYQRFEAAYVVASGRTLAPPAEVAAAREELRLAARGLLGAHVEPWLYQSLPPGEVDLAMGERVLRRAPSAQALARHADALASARRAPPRPP